MFHEFPKAMYRHGEYMAVNDAGEEAEAVKKGWTDYYTDRERQAEEVNDLAGLREKATALGIKVHHLWKEPRLRDEIAKAQ